MRIPRVDFTVRGARVRHGGAYRLEGSVLDFSGVLRLDAIRLAADDGVEVGAPQGGRSRVASRRRGNRRAHSCARHRVEAHLWRRREAGVEP